MEPELRQRSGVERGEHGGKVMAQGGAVARDEPRHRDAVPGRDADLAGEASFAHGRDVPLVARDGAVLRRDLAALLAALDAGSLPKLWFS